MARIEISGASDDLIVVEGAVDAEFGCYDEGSYVIASDGTVLYIEYGDNGCWNISRKIAGTAAYEHDAAEGPDSVYTDKAILEGDIDWVARVKAEDFAQVRG